MIEPTRIYQYSHEYHQVFVYKSMIAQKPDRVHMTFADVLESTKRIHAMTRGLQQINYLTGWQYDGHDSNYPAWFAVNHRLGRAHDADARASFLWLMREARERYNAVVSIHINMDDAYEHSPLWNDYVKHDLLLRQPDGALIKGGIWDGDQAYLVCKAKEWAAGLAKTRIDRLLELLPLADAGTVHIDVFQPHACPGLGVSYDDDVRAMIAILDYWQSFGIDVTKEWFHHEFAGRVPMVYHCNMDERSRLKYPPAVACGGGPGWNLRHARTHEQAAWGGFFTAPEAGCIYDEAWGIGVDADSAQLRRLDAFMRGFYLRTLPFIFLNARRATLHTLTNDDYAVTFTDDVVTHVRRADRYLTMRQGDRLFVDGTDLCVPALWREHECISYSQEGCSKSWELPAEWGLVTRVKIDGLAPYGNRREEELPTPDQRVTLTLQPGEAVCVAPV